MTEYYENGPEGMPRVERMTRSTIMAVLSQKDVPTIYVSREEDYNSLCKFAHAVAEETLARVPAWPAESTTAPVSLTDEQIIQRFESHINTDPDCFDLQDGDCAYWIKQSEMVKFARALLAAAPAPIQQVPTPWCTDAHFEAWCERHDMRKDRGDHREMFDDAASLYLTVPATPPALAGSQVQAADDARDAARYRWLRERRDIPHGSRNIPWVVALDPEEKIHTMILRAGIDLDHAIDATMREQP